MKVLYLTNIPVPYRVDFFNELGKYCDLTVLYERNEAKNREKNWLNSDNVNFKKKFLLGKDIGDDSAFCREVIKYLNNQYDLIVIGGYSTPTAMYAIMYMKLKRIKFILNADGGIIKKELIFNKIIKKFFISSAYSWLSTSNSTTNYLMYYGAKKEKIYVYPFTSILEKNILPQIIEKEEKSSIKKKMNINEDKIIISVGQFIPRKGFDILIKASKDLNDNVGVYIIGGTPTNEYLDLIKSLELKNIHFIPFKGKNSLYMYYKLADLFVLPTREDIWGLVINEAMAMGLPIITTDRCVAGINLIKNNENGYIVPIDNESELSAKIKYILDNNDLQSKMGENSLKVSINYTIEKMAQEHYTILNNILRSIK